MKLSFYFAGDSVTRNPNNRYQKPEKCCSQKKEKEKEKDMMQKPSFIKERKRKKEREKDEFCQRDCL